MSFIRGEQVDNIIELENLRPQDFINANPTLTLLRPILSHIDAEADDKAMEMELRAEEEFRAEKRKIFSENCQRIDTYFERKRKQVDTAHKVYTSNKSNESRVSLLIARDKLLQQVLAEAQNELKSVSGDKEKYPKIIKGLILQGILQLLEPEVVLRCSISKKKMDAGTVKNECEVIIGFEHNFLEKGVAVIPIVPFIRNAKYLTFEGQHITIPSGNSGVVTEVHFGVIISQEAKEISKDNALDFVNGYVVALNSKLRDDEYKKASDSESFSTITDFKDAVVISNVITKELLPHPNAATIWAKLNGKECQRGNLTDARMSVQELIEKASQLKTLRAGDIILSGTPAGSFYVKLGDTVEIGIEDIIQTQISVQKEAETISTQTQEKYLQPKDDKIKGFMESL